MVELTPEELFFPIQLATSILAMNPYNLNRGKATINPWKVLYMVTLYIIYFILTVISFSSATIEFLIDEDLRKIKTIDFVVLLQRCGNGILILLTTFIFWFHIQKLLNELYAIVKIDSELQKYTKSQRRHRYGKSIQKKIVLLLLLEFAFTILGNTFTLYFLVTEFRWYYVVILAHPKLIITNVNISFYLLTMMLEQQYKTINDILQEKRTESTNARHYPVDLDFCTEVTQLACLHKKLTKTAMRVNSMFSLYLLLWIAINFGSLISDSYVCFYIVLFEKLGRYPFLFASFVKNLILYTYYLVYVTKRSSDLCLEADKTRKILVCINIGVEKEDERNAVVAAALKLMQNKLEVTACKLFKIDNALLFSICGAASSYLFVMIQLDLGDQKNNSTSF